MHPVIICNVLQNQYAGMAELADAQDLGSCAARCAGSTPVTRTMIVADVIVRGDFSF